MSKDFLQPKDVSRAQVLDTMADSSRWINPNRWPFMKDSWPKPQTEPARAHEKMLSTQTEWAKKGPIR